MNYNSNNVIRQGYTLLEVIIVLVLIGLLLSISIPNINIIGNFEEKEEMKTFRRDIISGKNKSIAEGTIYTLNINRENDGYNIVNNNGKIKEFEFLHWEIIECNFLDDRIRFTSNGYPEMGGKVRLKNKKGKITEITVEPVTGKLNIYEN